MEGKRIEEKKRLESGKRYRLRKSREIVKKKKKRQINSRLEQTINSHIAI